MRILYYKSQFSEILASLLYCAFLFYKYGRVYTAPSGICFYFQNTERNHLIPSSLILREKHISVLHVVFPFILKEGETICGKEEDVTPPHQPPAVSLSCFPSFHNHGSFSSKGNRSFPLSSPLNMLVIHGRPSPSKCCLTAKLTLMYNSQKPHSDSPQEPCLLFPQQAIPYQILRFQHYL